MAEGVLDDRDCASAGGRGPGGQEIFRPAPFAAGCDRFRTEGGAPASRQAFHFIDAISGQHLWAESYDRELKDIFSLQDEVILKITSAMSVNLTAGEQARAWAEGTKSLEAYLKLMQGREYRYKGNRESIALARRMAEEAIALDPKYAEAYVLLGVTYYLEVFQGTTRPKDVIPKATELIQKALALNGSLAEARSSLGVLYTWSGRYDEGIAEAERGVELDPNSGQEIAGKPSRCARRESSVSRTIWLAAPPSPLSTVPAAGKRRRGKKQPKSSESILNSPWNPLWGTLLIRIRPTGTVSPKVCARRD